MILARFLTGSSAVRDVPLCRQFRNVPSCRLGNDKVLVHCDGFGAGIALLKV